MKNGSSIIKTKYGPIEYKIHGEKGPFIVSVHGAPGFWRQYKYTCNGLYLKDYRILSWSRPGYFRTPLSTGKTCSEQAGLLYELMKELKISKASIISFSCGGPCAIEFALKYPEVIDSLIFESAVSGNYSMYSEDFFRYMFDLTLLSKAGLLTTYTLELLLPKVFAVILLYRYGYYSIPELFMRSKSIFKSTSNKSIFAEIMTETILSYAHIKEGFDNDANQCINYSCKNLNRINKPTLIIHGEQDSDVPITNSVRLANNITNNRFIKIKGGSHLLSLTHAEEIFKLKNEFLKDVYLIK